MATSRISLEPSVLRVGKTKEDDVLIGSKCKECGRFFFPQRKRCAYCSEPTAAPVEFSREGTLTSYSLLNRKPDYALIETPYILGEVTIPEGIVIYSVISEKNAQNLEIGQKVRLDTMEIKKDEDGNNVIVYTFKPVS